MRGAGYPGGGPRSSMGTPPALPTAAQQWDNAKAQTLAAATRGLEQAIADLTAERDELLRTIDVIRRMHRRSGPGRPDLGHPAHCRWCDEDWPCDEILVVDAPAHLRAAFHAIVIDAPTTADYFAVRAECVEAMNAS